MPISTVAEGIESWDLEKMFETIRHNNENKAIASDIEKNFSKSYDQVLYE